MNERVTLACSPVKPESIEGEQKKCVYSKIVLAGKTLGGKWRRVYKRTLSLLMWQVTSVGLSALPWQATYAIQNYWLGTSWTRRGSLSFDVLTDNYNCFLCPCTKPPLPFWIIDLRLQLIFSAIFTLLYLDWLLIFSDREMNCSKVLCI